MISKPKYFNQDSLSIAAQILQPVTPTDGLYQAHYYNEDFGHRIFVEQENFIRGFRKALLDCRSKEDVKNLINGYGVAPKWPPYINKLATSEEEIQKSNYEFWTNGFGGLIRENWFNMMNNFMKFINELR